MSQNAQYKLLNDFYNTFKGQLVQAVQIQQAHKVAQNVHPAVGADVRAKLALQRNAAAVMLAQVRFGTPDTVLSLPQPDLDHTFLVAVWHYARGAAFAAKGDAENATAELKITLNGWCWK